MLLRAIILVVIVSTWCINAFATVTNSPLRASFVTGANGYVGREIVHAIIEKEKEINDNDNNNNNGRAPHKIICLVRDKRVKEEQLYWKEKSDCITVLPYDMLDGGVSLSNALSTVYNNNNNESNNNNNNNIRTCVYHVASSFGPSDDHEQRALDNVKGTKDLVETIAKFNTTNCHLIVTSSMAAVRGSGQEPKNGKFYSHQDWNTISKLGANWGSSYQWSKAESERVAWDLSKKYGIPMTSMCPAFVFGPPSSSDGIVSNSFSITLVGSWVRGESPVQSRLCVDIRDVARAHVAAAYLSEKSIGQRYIVSKQERIPSQEMAKALQKIRDEIIIDNNGNNNDMNEISFDGNFQGGAIAIGDQEVEATDRLYNDLGISLRSVEETMSDMGRALLQIGQTKT